MWGFASEGSNKEQRRSAAERKAKQSHTPAPEARHRTHSPAQRTPPAARRNGGEAASMTRAHAPRSGAATATNPHGGKAENVGSYLRRLAVTEPVSATRAIVANTAANAAG